MNDIINTELEKLRPTIEDHCFQMTVYEDDGGHIFTELEMWTDCVNEDCIVDIAGSTAKEFLDNLNDYIENFDEEEYEEPWIKMGKEARRERGAPESILDLLNSAKEFKDALDSLYYDCISLSKKVIG